MSHFQSNYISFLETVEDLYKKNKIAEALVLVFAVIDSVSKEKYSSLYSSERTKKFIEDNFLIITEYGFPGILASSIQIKIEDDVEFNYNFPIPSNRMVKMKDLFYYALRCNLIHEAKVPEDIIFTDSTIIGNWKKSGFLLPKAILIGLVMAVRKGLNS